MPRGMKVPDPVRKRPGSGIHQGRRSFSAQHPGNCATCRASILAGDEIFYAPGNESPSGLDCCGDRPDEDLIVFQRRDEAADEENPAASIARVMPRGRTARDTCPRCFQVLASNGSCGCDY